MKAILLIFMFISNIAICQIQGVWSGTMDYTISYETITGKGHRTYHLNVQDNIVTGTMSAVDSSIIEGKLYWVGTCRGLSGRGELLTVWIYNDDHYSINIETPEFECTKSDGGYGDPGRYNAAIETKWPTPNKNVLAGSHTETVPVMNDDFGHQTTTIVWSLHKSNDAVLIVTPSNYDTWLPEPGKNELTKGSSMKIDMALKSVNGQPLNVKVDRFELKLLNTSQEPGITINMPLEPQVDLPDLRFAVQPNCTMKENFQGLDINCNGCTNASATIDCYDGGAYSTLSVTAVLVGGDRLQGMLLLPGGVTDIPIPKRDPGSNIAISWLNAHGDPKDDDDDEHLQGNQNPGDGLSAYEEYRGVISQDKFKRLDPQKLDLGVRMKKTDIPVFAKGLSWFETATTINIIRFWDTEIKDSRELNNNNKTSNIYHQYVEKLINAHVDGAVGENVPVTQLTKIPKESERAVIDISQIRIEYQKQVNAINAANARYHTNLRVPYGVDESIANTVAHELAHGINVNHHGDLSQETTPVTIQPGTYDSVYNENRNAITDRPFKIEGGIGSLHNDESGEISCIMAYTGFYQWVKRLNNFGGFSYYAIKLLPQGNTFCNSKKDKSGSLNYNNAYFSDAKYGNCMSQVKFK